MKPGSRSLGIAFSDGPERSRLGGALVRADGRVDDLVGATCTVGGTDATAATIDLFETLDREDVRRLVIAGIAPAWFNVVDLRAVHRAVDRPVLSVSYEPSPGLESAIREAFDGEEGRERQSIYRSLPERRRVSTSSSEDGPDRFVRAVGVEPDRAEEIVRRLTIDGADRPEPVRVAKRAARAFRRFAGDSG
ncbi:DUF99 family protein [Halopenitus salinus]|uniref:UPF0215 protein ACFQE9_07760 n=1 Tax=Halopenitus salinus TaxID=1198295 RepID=A0ABD5USL0_9EURY